MVASQAQAPDPVRHAAELTRQGTHQRIELLHRLTQRAEPVTRGQYIAQRLAEFLALLAQSVQRTDRLGTGQRTQAEFCIAFRQTAKHLGDRHVGVEHRGTLGRCFYRALRQAAQVAPQTIGQRTEPFELGDGGRLVTQHRIGLQGIDLGGEARHHAIETIGGSTQGQQFAAAGFNRAKAGADAARLRLVSLLRPLVSAALSCLLTVARPAKALASPRIAPTARP